MFTSLVLLTGPIWARPVWGWWWDFKDIRLNLTALLFFVYIGYLLLRSQLDEPERRARLSAVVGVLGFNVLAVAEKVNLMRTFMQPSVHSASSNRCSESRIFCSTVSNVMSRSRLSWLATLLS